ncbi:cytoplasmic 60s subunit biogenesis factor rei1 like protein [Acrodontium crateriforme]|uniref:Cytoplasmic 60s subunit biogenesis factor rei1 like protein n=1 Tax=Acrodontium crateriforme TaxID=150365 RepID=A0AAQ3RBL1_9PEZI|nr:cytoplasmic 60s subunit biogenesis factor rei1 like protein [Acrodontium crateriforme]
MATLAQAPTAAPVATNQSHPFTCNTCQVAFRSSDLQRTHMQSDWHRYNLKRRVASLPPLTSEVFAEKVLANKANAAATAARASFVKRCDACDKTYYSEGAYVNHVGSQKHKLIAARFNARAGHDTESMADSTFSLGDPMETASTTASTMTARDPEAEEEFDEVVESIKKTKIGGSSDPVPDRPTVPTPGKAVQANGQAEEEETDEDEEYEHKADIKQCLFCNYVSPTKELNINHMSKQHGFFIPERDYLVDLDGLVTYLHETISVLHQCLYCHKQVHTTAGVQTHMRDRGHCMIAYSTEDEQMEVGEFYDFRSTYSDDETDSDSEEANGGVRLGAKRAAKTTIRNENGEDVEMDENDEGWESDDSDASSVPTDEITSIPIDRKDRKYSNLDKHKHHSHGDPRPHKNADGFHSHAHSTPQAVYHDDYELHLPSGRTAGHRSLRAYFRQNLRNYPSAEERAEQRMLEEARHDSDADDSDVEEPTTRGRGRQGQLVSRADGGMGMIGVSEAKKREIKAVEKRELKRAQREQKRYEWGNNKQNNFQKHFRDPLLQ